MNIKWLNKIHITYFGRNSTLKQPLNYKNANEHFNGGGSIIVNEIDSFKNGMHKYKLECANLRLDNSKLKKKNSELEDKNRILIENLEKMELKKEKVFFIKFI